MTKYKKIILVILVFSFNGFVYSLDLWRHPESAEINSMFIDIRFASISFQEGFYMPPTELGLDYLFPFFLPLSLGVYVKTPNPNLKSFGLRAAYHIDIRGRKTDLYFLYVFDFGFLRNDILFEYNDKAAEIRYYDFRAGIRRVFGKYIALAVESGFKFHEIIFGVTIKLF